MPLMFFAIFVVGLFLAFMLRIGTSQYQDTQWFLYSVAASFLAAHTLIRPRFGKAASLLFIFCVYSAVELSMWRYHMFRNTREYDRLGLMYFVSDALAKLLIVVLPIAAVMKERSAAKAWGGILAAWMVVGNLVLVFHQFFATGDHCRKTNTCGGLLYNPSTNCTMIAVMMPFVLKYFPRPYSWIVFACAAFATVAAQSRIGTGMLAMLLVMIVVYERRWRILMLLPAAIVPAVHYISLKKDMLATGSRAEMWSYFMKLWAVSPSFRFGTWRDWWPRREMTIDFGFFEVVGNPITINTDKWEALYHALHWKVLFDGVGFGSYGVFARNLQGHFGKQYQIWWISMHNDWLTFAFQLGLWGLGLAALVYLLSARGFYRRQEAAELQSLILFGLAMAMNYPLHIAMGCAFGAWLVLLGLMKDERGDLAKIGTFTQNRS